MWKQRLISTERGDFEIFTAGSGEPLCVTHLYSEFDERGYYFADRFVEDFTVHLINLKEAGKSTGVKDAYEMSMSETSKDLEAIRTALGFADWNYAGHSTGGMLGLVYAANHPDSLKRLIVGGASATKGYVEDQDSIYSEKNPANKRFQEIFFTLTSGDTSKEERQHAAREWTELSWKQQEGLDEYFSQPTSGKVVQKRLNYYTYSELPTYDIKKELSRIKTPTMIFCGKYDTRCPFVFSEEIFHLVPNSTLYIFENSSHAPHIEEREKFCGMVRESIYMV